MSDSKIEFAPKAVAMHFGKPVTSLDITRPTVGASLTYNHSETFSSTVSAFHQHSLRDNKALNTGASFGVSFKF
jgi:hypothetical protein